MKDLSIEEKAKRYDEAIELVNSKWHKVEDRLPSEDKDFPNLSVKVLVTNGERMGVTHYNFLFGEWEGCNTDSITHWMKLPQLPKEE